MMPKILWIKVRTSIPVKNRLLFFTCCLWGSRFPFWFFVKLGAEVKMAFTIVH